VLVWDGHDYLSHHRRWDYVVAPIRELGFDSNAARYSYDLVPVDASGAMSKGDPSDNAAFFGFGQPVLAPAAGTIVAAVDDQPDNRAFDRNAVHQELLVVYGNRVLIDHGHGEISVLAHLKQNSVKVKAGDKVAAGQPIAAIGASGSAIFPHLHYQLNRGSATLDPVDYHGTLRRRLSSPALAKLKAKPAPDPEVVAARLARAAEREAAQAAKREAAKAAREAKEAEKIAAAEAAAAAAEAAKPKKPKPLLSAEELKAARDARYAARKARKR